jgi:hypothetical protein
MTATADTIIIRRAGAADARILARLAALDSASTPGADSLVAELDGVAVAALDLVDRHVVADPFARTADVVEMLQLRASRIHGSHGARHRRGAHASGRRSRSGFLARA